MTLIISFKKPSKLTVFCNIFVNFTPYITLESIKKIAKIPSVQPKKNPHLHSPAHLLADELCLKLNDKRHFGFYLKMATLYDHAWLRKLCGEVLEKKDVKTPGKLFAYLIKKRNDEIKNSTTQSPVI